MVKTVAREFKWEPNKIDGLYLDDVDYFGLMYWYDDVIEVHAELKNNKG